MNAFINKNSVNVNDCKIFVTHFPCRECAKMIVQSRIKAIYYLEKQSGTTYDEATQLFEENEFPTR